MLFRRALIAFCVGAVPPLALASAAAPEAGMKTVVAGTVLLDPASPVCHVGEPCSKPLADFTLVFSGRGHAVRVRTDGSGRYRVSLVPGTYRVSPAAPKGLGSGFHPKRISVPAGERVVRNFTYDAGIR
jgi:hypothetical protein